MKIHHLKKHMCLFFSIQHCNLMLQVASISRAASRALLLGLVAWCEAGVDKTSVLLLISGQCQTAPPRSQVTSMKLFQHLLL